MVDRELVRALGLSRQYVDSLESEPSDTDDLGENAWRVFSRSPVNTDEVLTRALTHLVRAFPRPVHSKRWEDVWPLIMAEVRARAEDRDAYVGNPAITTQNVVDEFTAAALIEAIRGIDDEPVVPGIGQLSATRWTRPKLEAIRRALNRIVTREIFGVGTVRKGDAPGSRQEVSDKPLKDPTAVNAEKVFTQELELLALLEPADLSAQELEIAQLFAHGASRKAVAEALGVALGTVDGAWARARTKIAASRKKTASA